jgi:hypothetical protein
MFTLRQTETLGNAVLIHKEGPCPCNGDINRVIIMMILVIIIGCSVVDLVWFPEQNK